MSEGGSSKQHLRIIKGGKNHRQDFCGIPTRLLADNQSPLDTDGLACEEDRYLVMSAGTDVIKPIEHPLRVINQAWRYEPQPVGSVQFRNGKPLRFLLVVHDLDRAPTCRPIWILAALANLKDQLTNHPDIRSLALPLLGTRHGNLSVRESLDLLRQALSGSHWPIQQLLLMVPESSLTEVNSFLRQHPN